MIKFHDYCGLAGDLQMMLIGELDGRTETQLYTRDSKWSRNRAMKKIIRRFYRA